MTNFDLNPAALLMFEPAMLLTLMRGTNVTAFTCKRSNQSAGYTMHTGAALQLPQYQSLFQSDQRPSYEELLQVMADQGYEFSASHGVKLGELMNAQLLAVTQPQSPLGQLAQQAHTEFQSQVERLAGTLAAMLPKHKPGIYRFSGRKFWGMAQKRRGVFVWPEWSTARYVRVAVDVQDTQRAAVLALVDNWLQAEGLKIAPMPSF